MFNNQEFFDSIAPFEQLPLLLADDTERLSEEIQENGIHLSLPAGLCLEVPELVAFLNRVKLNRRTQLQASSLTTSLLYYLWHDEQAGQLRFNFISSLHQKLPFSCAISLVEREADIVTDFLSSPYLQQIPWTDFTAASEVTIAVEDAPVAAFVCKVYQEIIS